MYGDMGMKFERRVQSRITVPGMWPSLWRKGVADNGGMGYLAGKIRSPALDMHFEVLVRHLSSIRFSC